MIKKIKAIYLYDVQHWLSVQDFFLLGVGSFLLFFLFSSSSSLVLSELRVVCLCVTTGLDD